MKYTALILFIFLITAGILFPVGVFAQNTSAGIALSIPIEDKNAKDGNIISSTSKGYILSNKTYDSNAYGVLTESPALFIQNTSDPNLKPITHIGKAYTLVSTINGNIKKNDFITTSKTPGVGQKAAINGMIIGTALEGYSSSDKNATKKILVAVNPHYNTAFSDVKTNVLEVLRNAADPSALSQLTSLRYIIAAVIVLISFAIGFIYFGRIARSGVEAMGRNPLASRAIQLSLVFNLFLMIFIILVGLTIAFLILIL